MTANMVDFETIAFNPFQSEKSVTDDGTDPDINFFNFFECSYFSTEEVKKMLLNTSKIEKFNVLHINIRSYNKILKSCTMF